MFEWGSSYDNDNHSDFCEITAGELMEEKKKVVCLRFIKI